MDINNTRTVRALAAQVAATALSRAPDANTYEKNPPTEGEVVDFAKRIERYISTGS